MIDMCNAEMAQVFESFPKEDKNQFMQRSQYMAVGAHFW